MSCQVEGLRVSSSRSRSAAGVVGKVGLASRCPASSNFSLYNQKILLLTEADRPELKRQDCSYKCLSSNDRKWEAKSNACNSYDTRIVFKRHLWLFFDEQNASAGLVIFVFGSRDVLHQRLFFSSWARARLEPVQHSNWTLLQHGVKIKKSSKVRKTPSKFLFNTTAIVREGTLVEKSILWSSTLSH